MRRTSFSNKPAHQLGLTLIEIMIAVALSIGLLAGIVQVFTSSRQNYQLGNTVSDTQENGRFALNQLSEAFRYRGFQGCPSPRTNNPSTSYVSLSTKFPIKDLWKESLLGYNVTAPAENTTNNIWSATPTADVVTNSSFPTDLKAAIGKAAAPDSDVVSIYHASPAIAPVSQDMTRTTDTLRVSVSLDSNRITHWGIGDQAIVSDCSSVVLFTVSNVTPMPSDNPTEFELAHNKMATLSPNANAEQVNQGTQDQESDDSPIPIFYGPTTLTSTPQKIQAQVRRPWVDVFYIAQTSRTTAQGNPIFGLFRYRASDLNPTPVEVAEGVEYLGILYGETFTNGTVKYSRAKDVKDFRSVQSVRIGILVTGTVPQLKTDDEASYALPGITITKDMYGPHGSRYLRKVFTTTVQLQNQVDLMTNGS